MAKPKIAITSLAGCFGCLMSILDIDERILELAKDFRVDGAIVIQQKFCDPHETDIPFVRKHLEDNGIPTYFLEFDVTTAAGPFAIRVEAFLETLEAEADLF